jgi:hypothetical protein
MRIELSPYAHELDRYGTECVEDCPACCWVRERANSRKSRRVAKKPSVSVSLVPKLGEYVLRESLSR